MTCPDPDMIASFALGEAAGETSPRETAALRAHFQACAACAERYAEWSRIAIAGRLLQRESIAAAPCPDDNVFAEYLDGVLSPLARDSFEQHLGACGVCVQQLSAFFGALQEVSQPRPLGHIALAWVREGLNVLDSALEAFRPVPLQVSPVLRGEKGAPELAFEAEHRGISLRVTIQQGSASTVTLLLEIKQDSTGLPGCRIGLKSRGALLESRVTDPAGAVLLLGLSAGPYEIEAELPGEPVHFHVDIPAQA
jgi:hypothetical protein